MERKRWKENINDKKNRNDEGARERRSEETK